MTPDTQADPRDLIEAATPSTAAGRDFLDGLPDAQLFYVGEDGKVTAVVDVILAIEAAARDEGCQEAVERTVRETLAVGDGTTPLSVGEPLIQRCLAHVRHALLLNETEATR